MGTRSSSIDRQPPEIQELISKLRFQGRTIDEILAQLKALDVEVARSSLGRHVKSLASASERMRHSRNMATALVERFGSEPDNKLARLNLELMHGAMLQLLTASDDDEQGQAAPVTFSPRTPISCPARCRSWPRPRRPTRICASSFEPRR